MALHPFTRTHRPSQMQSELAAAGYGSAITTLRSAGFNPSTGLCASGEVVHDGTLTAPQLDAVINAHTPDIHYESNGKFKTGTTINNTPATTALLQLPENCQATVVAIVMARQGANQKQFELKVAATRGTGNASLIGTVVVQSWGSPTWTATLVATGQSVGVQVTGANGVTITWAGKISYEAAVL